MNITEIKNACYDAIRKNNLLEGKNSENVRKLEEIDVIYIKLNE